MYSNILYTGNKYKYIVNLQFIKLALKQKLSTLIVYNMFTCETYLIKKCFESSTGRIHVQQLF